MNKSTYIGKDYIEVNERDSGRDIIQFCKVCRKNTKHIYTGYYEDEHNIHEYFECSECGNEGVDIYF